MTLEKTYVFGCLIQGYEVEMLDEHLQSCKMMLEEIDNPENVHFDFCINLQEHFEKYENPRKTEIRIVDAIMRFASPDTFHVNWYVCSGNAPDYFYNIASYRRDLCHNWANKVDFVCWSETDSLWPKQTLNIVDQIASADDVVPKFLLTFAYRLNWDASWAKLVHPIFRSVKYEETDEFIFTNEASEKAYMPLSRMDAINDIPVEEIAVEAFSQPKADGSCLVISSELIRSGVNIPLGLIHCGEDESLCRMAKLVMGDEFVQYHVSNILRVHNRRHPRKRTGILNENNPKGLCSAKDKGSWWDALEQTSKFNLEHLRAQRKMFKVAEVVDEYRIK